MKLHHGDVTVEFERIEDLITVLKELGKEDQRAVEAAARALQSQINAEHGRLGGIATAKKRRGNQMPIIQPYEED